MLNSLWLTFKFLLSLLLVVVAIAAFAVALRNGSSSILLVASTCLVLAAAPWLTSPSMMNKSRLALPGVGILFVIGFAAMGIKEFQGLSQYPSICSGKNALMCHFINQLYRAGGHIAVGSFYTLISASLFLTIVAVLLKRAKKT